MKEPLHIPNYGKAVIYIPLTPLWMNHYTVNNKPLVLNSHINNIENLNMIHLCTNQTLKISVAILTILLFCTDTDIGKSLLTIIMKLAMISHGFLKRILIPQVTYTMELTKSWYNNDWRYKVSNLIGNMTMDQNMDKMYSTLKQRLTLTQMKRCHDDQVFWRSPKGKVQGYKNKLFQRELIINYVPALTYM